MATKQNSPISLAMLTTYNNKLHLRNVEEFVQQEDGKGLSSNDYTDDEKTKLGKSLTTDDFETEPIDWDSEWPTE